MSQEIVTEDGEVITTALVPQQPRSVPPPEQSVSQARVDSVARVLDAAYQRASTLELTEDESRRLTADFPDDAIRRGAKGKANLLYVEAASFRERLLSVFGPGRWVPVCRRMWTEECVTPKGAPAVRVYTDVVLLIRGCYVGEAIGAGNYFPKNPDQDYSDAAEAGQSEALRRICGKTLGVGLHLWNKAWCEAWEARQAGRGREPAPQEAAHEQPAKPNGATKANGPTEAELREKGLAILKVGAGQGKAALALAWSTLSLPMKKACEADKEKLKAQAEKVDATRQAVKDAGQIGAEEIEELRSLCRELDLPWAKLRDTALSREKLGVPEGCDEKDLTRQQWAALTAALKDDLAGKAAAEAADIF